jgi:Holliday junction resolvase
MLFESYCVLRNIYRRWNSDYGKILQTLLAISFDPRRGGFFVQNRLVEGVDLELTRGSDKYAIEVKTTEGTEISLQEKDIEGLRVKTFHGFTTAVAVLRLERAENWIIANAATLSVRDYTPARLGLYSIQNLENIALQNFEKTLLEFHEAILSPPGGQVLDFLTSILRQETTQPESFGRNSTNAFTED